MTSEDRDAILGRTLREKRVAAEHVAYLRAQARHIGETLGSLSNYLSGNLRLVRFADADPVTPYRPLADAPSLPLHTFNASEIDGKNIAALVREYHEAVRRLEQLEATAKELGF